MSKRSASDRTTDGQAFAKASGSGAKRDEIEVNDIGEFEDAWEDEIESEDDAVDGEAEDGEDGTGSTFHASSVVLTSYVD